MLSGEQRGTDKCKEEVVELEKELDYWKLGYHNQAIQFGDLQSELDKAKELIAKSAVYLSPCHFHQELEDFLKDKK